MEMIRLKNGTEVPLMGAIPAKVTIARLFETNWVAAYELVRLCRDANHRTYGNISLDLQACALTNSAGKVHDLVRNVVLSVAIGTGTGIRWTNPFAD
jgi:hypothetical protein